jgi:tetratricopeptide (TPR) repeat protein
MRFSLPVFLSLGLAVGVSAGENPKDATRSLGDLSHVGTVHLQSSCAPAAQKELERGVALLHSFFYEEARRVFGQAATLDAGCAMAHWGVAMTLWHPIWAPPNEDEEREGRAAIAQAKAIGGRTQVERGFIAALDAFYNTTPGQPGEPTQSCHGIGGGDHASRAAAYETAMAKLAASFPDDVEVATFHALALLGTAPPSDRTLARQARAAETLERFYARHPKHPGIIHYLIHAYDYPPTAQKGLAYARAYAEIAPWVPHVQHMPAHIFTRLGMWPEVIQSNLASAAAARQYAGQHHPGSTSFDELHALDYLVYGYLQTAQDAKAREVLGQVTAVKKTHPEVDFAVAYATGAIPARHALERRKWDEAAALPEMTQPSWARYPFGAGHLLFARGLGAARMGRVEDARRQVARLTELANGMTEPRVQYFAKQAQMQVRVLEGWVAFAEKRNAEAERILREAADTDDALGKHPVSPGSILPAREILADFLSDTGRSAEALREYEGVLKLYPGRLNALAGAGRAAEKAGDTEAARRYYGALVAMVAADADRAEVAAARAFMKEHPARASR